MINLKAIVLGLLIGSIGCLRIAIINDVHLNTSLADPSETGVYGEDAKIALFKMMVDDLHDEYHASQSTIISNPDLTHSSSDDQIDVVLVLGDFVVHGLSSKNQSVNNWEKMKPQMSEQMLYLQEVFPNTPILPTLGNNDVIYHYQVPGTDEMKQTYYGDIYEMWFGATGPSANNEYDLISEVRESFLEGGYYRFNIHDRLTVISLNTLYFHVRNEQDLEGATMQLAWLRNQIIKSLPSHKFILIMHVIPGMVYGKKADIFWKEQYVLAFTQILQDFSDKILLVIIIVNSS